MDTPAYDHGTPCEHMGATFARNTDGEIVEQVLVEVHYRRG
jgi:hypothetical protein